jgi:uncharacterized protein YndB with AHSA1/START domain
VAEQKSNPVGASSDREIVISRVLDAPRALVFDVWTDPQHVGAWYGPRGFTITTLTMDVKPGGAWKFVMHGPDGVDFSK